MVFGGCRPTAALRDDATKRSLMRSRCILITGGFLSPAPPANHGTKPSPYDKALSGHCPLPIMTNTDWLTLALVVITAFYAWATLKILRANESMVSAMREQQNAAMRPYILVSATLRTGTQLFYLSIKNVGKTAALSLKLSLDRNFYQNGEKRDECNIGNTTAFSNVIDSLPPEGQLLFILGTGPSLFRGSNTEDLCPLLFQVTAKYVAGSESVSETSIVDLRPYKNTVVQTNPVVEELQKLREEFKKLSTSLNNKL